MFKTWLLKFLIPISWLIINAPQNAEVDENATCDLLQEGEELIRLDSKSTFTSVQSRWHHVPPTDDNIEREKTNNLDPAVSTNAGLSESEGATAGLVTNLFLFILYIELMCLEINDFWINVSGRTH